MFEGAAEDFRAFLQKFRKQGERTKSDGVYDVYSGLAYALERCGHYRVAEDIYRFRIARDCGATDAIIGVGNLYFAYAFSEYVDAPSLMHLAESSSGLDFGDANRGGRSASPVLEENDIVLAGVSLRVRMRVTETVCQASGVEWSGV